VRRSRTSFPKNGIFNFLLSSKEIQAEGYLCNRNAPPCPWRCASIAMEEPQ